MSAHDEAVAAALAAVKNDGPFGCKDVVGSCVTPHRCTCVRDTETAITAYLSHLRAAGSGYTAGAEAMREAAQKVAMGYPIPDDARGAEEHGRCMASLGIAAAIRALPLPEPPAE